jgi:S1-C subfamily serine protease
MDRDLPHGGEPIGEPHAAAEPEPPQAESREPQPREPQPPEPRPAEPRPAEPRPDGWWPVHAPLPPGPASEPPFAPVAREPEPPVPAAPRGPRVGKVAFVAALAGALVGGGVSGGIVALVDHHRSTTIVQASTGASDGTRPSTVLAHPGDIRSILAKVEPAVVRIDVTAQPDEINSQSGTGTGFIIDPNGVIVTNAHVADAETAVAAKQLIVTLADGDAVPGRVLGVDRAQDLAVVKIARTGLPTVQLGDSDSLQVGDAVVAIGNALGIAGSPTVTSGIVSGLGRTVTIPGTETLVDAIQTDAAINPGNSGGPLVDADGRVIGINTAIADPGSSNNVGFAISISSAEPVIDALRAGRTPKIAFMGVKTETLTPSLVQQAHLSVQAGAYVADVTPGLGAARAGIRRGDVIVEIDGRGITSNDDVLRIVREHQAGGTLSVTIERGSEHLVLRVTLGDLPNT